MSYIRSYASYPKEARDVFCFKKLHLGHVAKSYALRDPPTKITGLGKGNWVRSDERKRERKSALKVRKKALDCDSNYSNLFPTRSSFYDSNKFPFLKGEERVIKAQKKRINQKALVMSEYASGFDGIDLSAMAKEKKPKKNQGQNKFKGKK